MGIILMYRVVCRYGPVSAVTVHTPRRLGCPPLPVARGVLKVTVLYQFGIYSAVGSIADILKKYSYQVIAYRLFVGFVYRQPCIHLFYSGKILARLYKVLLLPLHIQLSQLLPVHQCLEVCP